MLRAAMVPRHLFLPLCLLAACTTPPAGSSPAPTPAAATPAPAAGPTATATATPPVPPGGHAQTCDGARFDLPPTTVVATVDGKPITAADLGPELARAENSALRTYCNAVADVRAQAVDHQIRTQLLAKVAGTEDPQAWLRAKVEAQVAQPTDEEVTKFYEANKAPNSPALDQVRDQVVAAMRDEQMQTEARKLIEELRSKATVTTTMPDVRPPPVDLADAPTTAAFGPTDAKVHVVEFSDFECPYCSRAATEVNALKKEFGDKIRVSYRHFPLSFHPSAHQAAVGAQCAVAQQKFWEFHDAVFAASAEHALANGGVRKAAEQAQLDMTAFDACMVAGDANAQVEADMQKATEAGVEGTPSFFINGRPVQGGTTELRSAIEAELAKSS